MDNNHNNEDIDLEKDRARAGSTPHIARYVLVISTVIAIVALSIVWMTGSY
ncbi:MAG: hypothetical protein OSA47_08580 [Novosphingopyxis baekryungensis]|jgi:hypothetical protein|nr:hypothetical protein [Novosphingopyxis baekryungensis]